MFESTLRFGKCSESNLKRCERIEIVEDPPSPSGRGRREAPGEGGKSLRILRPSPCPLPRGEGRFLNFNSFTRSCFFPFKRIKEIPTAPRRLLHAFYDDGFCRHCGDVRAVCGCHHRTAGSDAGP